MEVKIKSVIENGKVVDFEFDNAGESYVLPDGYDIGVGKDGSPAIFDIYGDICDVTKAKAAVPCLLSNTKRCYLRPALDCSVDPDILRELRLKNGMSQTELAIASGLTKDFIAHVEQGARSLNNVKLENAFRLADALGESVYAFARR